MSLFPRAFVDDPDRSFGPLVRLLNDWDTYARDGQVSLSNNDNQRRHHVIQTFSPKFDVIETDKDYQLHGELGGIEKQNVHLEFTDEHTLVVKGRVEKSYSTGEPPQSAGAIEAPASDGHKATARKEEKGERTDNTEVAQTTNEQPQQKKPTYKYWLS